MTSIYLPDSVTTIGSNPFVGCWRITFTCDSSCFRVVDDLLISKEGKLIACLSDKIHITIPDFVTTIGDSAFCGCYSLISIHLSDSVTMIVDYAFDGCHSLTTIHFPDSLTTIGDYAFRSCCSLTTTHLPASLVTIGDWAFDNCDFLTSIHIPKGTKAKFKQLLKAQYLIDKLVEE